MSQKNKPGNEKKARQSREERFFNGEKD